ncbi:serine threonine kinase Sgk2 [Fusarium pseudoanthophilum]|uniref:non-specific serine/threonine protein kinase n=1 Tax=Fusarium pseudoanthophilum TaxID=48495 RepID=A0A8H5LDH8_9HYPO|nr:serine threonine kinase Sgk2 [Fusarium pseudoanthophilum]
MEDILADTNLIGRSFFEQVYCRNNSVTTLLSPEARYVEPGYHECYVVGVPYKESSSLWDRAHVVGIDIPPDSEVSYEEGVEKLLDLAMEVFLHQPTRVYMFGLFEMSQQREFWFFDRTGVYRSGLFDDECNLQALLDQYGNMTELELGKNPFIEQEVGGPQYIYIKGDESQMAPYESDQSRGYKLVLDEKPVSIPREIVSVRPTWYRATDEFNNEFLVRFSGKELNQNEERFLRRTKERNVWGITHPIDYQHIKAGRQSCTVMLRFGRPIAYYGTVLEVLECMRDAIKAHRSLYKDAKILHRDICLRNLFIPHPENNSPDASKGILFGFDSALDLEIEPEKPYQLDGTESFVAIDLSRSSDDSVLPTYRHDLESFFYVFLFIAIGGHRGLPGESRLKLWCAGIPTWPEIAENKRKDISSNDNFAAILAEFRQEFKGLESLAYALRDVLFFPDGNDFFTGTNMDVEATEKLYGGMIGAFERAVIENRG